MEPPRTEAYYMNMMQNATHTTEHTSSKLGRLSKPNFQEPLCGNPPSTLDGQKGYQNDVPAVDEAWKPVHIACIARCQEEWKLFSDWLNSWRTS